MDISINLTDGVPIYRQIVSQVKYLVASGLIQPGEELPPIRTLALQLKVTPNTIVKAYGELRSRESFTSTTGRARSSRRRVPSKWRSGNGAV